MTMMKPIKILLLLIGGSVLLLALMAVSLILFFHPNDYKPQLQAAASEALGMEVSVNGQLGIGLYPGMRLTMKDVRVRNQGNELMVVEKLRVGLELFPLLQDEVRIKNVSLIQPRITIERGADGKYNFDKPQVAEATLPTFELSRLSISDGTLIYTDKQSGERFNAGDCDIKLRNLKLEGEGTNIMQKLSFTAKLFCGKIRIKEYLGSGLKLSVDAKNGLFDIKPVTLNLFGGDGSGSIRADYSRTTPHYQISFALPQFRTEELFKAKSPKAVLTGPMSFSMKLSLQGKSAREVERSASGDVVLQGKNLKLHGHDLDLAFSRYESSQSFNMLDMGALLVAGPVGLAVTKGSDFANVLAGSGGVSDIRTIVTSWRVKRGVMYAKDVAMATNRHRMALLGGLDFINGSFIDVTLALINHKGCAEVQQNISGPFRKPVVQQPSIIKSVAGPVLKLFEKGRKLLPGGECKVIYAGSVAPPR